ncbi:hypothetical protein HLB44_14840 [Aquincola sp. S2]|uniref:Uncharacterized protein n=1 Tax=Pseudaquabacterium terrae TaxID=2732868 RepID=A0ABX2EI09_9BURK|nr:hypothetical protein [Aquabacterium terrae]NRF68267.1 hypothetical protein [Aquabacterium terrae]
MSQAAFLFDTPAAAPGATPAALRAPGRPQRPAGTDHTAFEIGWDFAHYRLTPPVAHLHADNPVRQGWSAGRAGFGSRTLRPSPAVRRWLQLRLAAWQRGQAFEGVQVTPNFLAQLEVTACPVTLQPLGRGDEGPADAVIERLNGRAAYAAGNLAMLSGAARQALVGHDCAAALAYAQRIDAGEQALFHGLDGDEWRRLAVLASFATPLPHAEAAALPLLVLPPNRVRVLNPVQALQVMLTLQFCQAGYARRLVALAALMPSSEVRHAFQVFMHTMLARRLAAGPVLGGDAMRAAMVNAWRDALVQRRWARLATLLDAAACERLLQRAARRGLLGPSQRWHSAAQATEGWALEEGQASAMPATDGVVSANPMSH